MKVTFYSILTSMLLVLTGCSTNLLVQRLEDYGVTPANTTKLKFIGSDGGVGPDIQVIVKDPEVIKSVWTRIYSATPTDFWGASGFRRVEFYTSKKTGKSAATLLLNGTDAAYLEGDLWYHLDSGREGYYGLWRCPGLEKLVMWHLKREYERRKSNP